MTLRLLASLPLGAGGGGRSLALTSRGPSEPASELLPRRLLTGPVPAHRGAAVRFEWRSESW